MAVTIYKKDGSERMVTWKAGEATGNGSIVVSGEVQTSAGRWAKPELEYSGTWMGECFVTLNISCAVPIDFEIGDYIIYRNEKFVINYDPTVIKKARRGTHGDGFVYDSVKFNSLSNELTDMRMLDYVIGDNQIHYSGLPKFSFFCDTVDKLADRLQANSDRWCADNGITGADKWMFLTPNYSYTLTRCGNSVISTWEDIFGSHDDPSASTENEKVNQNVNVDNQSVWDTLKEIKDTFGLNFIIRGRKVIIGSEGLPTDIFRYGKGNGLYEIERVADSEQQVVTKLFAYGSNKNLPIRYYANLNVTCSGYIQVMRDTQEVPFTFLNVTYKSDYFTRPTTYNGESVYAVSFTFAGNTYNGYLKASSETQEMLVGTLSVLITPDQEPPFSSYELNRITFTSGVDKDKWPSEKEYPSVMLPDNMAVNVLMLPGFPSKSLYEWVVDNGGTAVNDPRNSDSIGRATWSPRQGVTYDAFFSKDNEQPYILSRNFAELGIREATKYFDGSDEDEIYPTIKNSGYDYIVDADTINDNGIGTEMDNFYIYLPNFGNDFLLDELLQSDSAIEMTDGYCGGRVFEIASATFENGRWKCYCQRDHDETLDLWYPHRHKDSGDNGPNQVLGRSGSYSGDHYVLTGIEMTDYYVNKAAEALLEASLVFLAKNDYTRYTYSPKIDEIFMARQHDGVESGDTATYGNRSYYLTLKEGDIMSFADRDLDLGDEDNNISVDVFIDTLQIKEYSNGNIPTYEVTLRNDKQVGTIQRLQEKVNSIVNGSVTVNGIGGSVNVAQIRQLIQSYGKDLFLSKVANDAAKGVITFLNGLQAGAEGAWGWVKETYNNLSGGVAWFKNLLADYLQPTIVKVMNYLTGNEGSLVIHGDVFVTADPENNKDGDLNLAGDLNAENANIRNMLTTNNLTVTGLAHFFELIIDKIKAAGGAQLFTPADGFKVEDITDTTINNTACKVLWWRATDGDRETTNMWEVGDQAICMNFNLTREREGEVMRDVENKNFWALVAEKDDNPVLHTYGSSSSSSSDEEDTVLSHYITIYTGSSTTDSAEPLNPRWINNAYKVAIGDEIAMLGHRFTDADYENGVLKEEAKARQSAVYISAYASYDTGNGDDLGPLQPPFLAFYKGIDDFNLGSHRGTYMDAKGSRFVGKFISSSTSQDIENMLRGSEFDIIYGVGNPNTVSHPHYAWNQEAGEYLSHVGWLYFDIDLEPATEGGRLWRWSYIDSDSSSSSSDEPYYTWVNINDVDSLAALDKIRDVASDGVLTGGAEKTRVYLEWVDAKKTALSLLAQAEENGLDQADDEFYNISSTSSSSSDEEGRTYAEAYNNVDSTFRRLSTYLNNKTSFNYVIDGVPAWIDPQNIYVGIKVSTSLPAWLNTESPAGKAEWTTGPLAYRGVWSDFWDAIVELTRALNAWQYKTIDEMGDDGMLDPAEKATLRQIFTDMVKGWYVDSREVFSIISVLPTSGDGITQQKLSTASSQLRYAIQAIGSYMAGYEPTPNDEDNPSSWSYSTYGWVITSAMEEGLVDPVSGSTATNLYPLWLQKEHDSESNLVKDNIWDYFWKDYAIKRDTLTEYLSEARQYQIDHIDVELQETFYIDTLTNPPGLPTPPYKVGDHMYRITQLTNPVTGETSTSDNDGIFYDHYICINDRSAGSTAYESDWELLSAVQRHMMSADAQMIYQTIFSSTSSSSIVQRLGSITSTVSAIVGGNSNLLLNGNFEDGTNHYSAYNSGTISVVAQSGLPNYFGHCLKVETSSGSTRGMSFSNSDQPHIFLENGKTYTFSFWAKAEITKNIRVYRNSDYLGQRQLTASWERYSYTIDGDGKSETFYVRDATNADTTTFYLVGLQLECGARSDWKDYFGELVNMQSQIRQTASEIELSVKKDGVESCGLKIDGTNDTTTLYGNKVVIEGDLDIRGLTTENVTIVEHEYDTPTVVNMGVVDDDTTGTIIKSVAIKASNTSWQVGAPSGTPHVVVLPFYDSLIDKTDAAYSSSSDWRNQTDITFKSDDTFFLRPQRTYAGVTEDVSLVKVVRWKESGTKLTIINEPDNYCNNWQDLLDSRWDADATQQSARTEYVNWLQGHAVVVCADARVICSENIHAADIGSNKTYDPSAYTDSSTLYDSGLFYAAGYISRFITILPGQQLMLRSQIMNISSTRRVLVWIVENPTEFVPMGTKQLYVYDYVLRMYGAGNPQIDFSHARRGVSECWMAHEVLLKNASVPLNIFGWLT